MKQIRIKPAAFALILIILVGCEDFLDVKPSTDLVVPDNLADLRALLDNDITVMGRDPSLQLLATDDLSIREGQIDNLNEQYRNTYLWQNNPMDNDGLGEWQLPYQQVFYANVVLDEIKTIVVRPDEEVTLNDLKGSALFYRAYNFFNLATVFCMPYRDEDASSIPGIPLRLSSNVNIRSERANLKATFDQIIRDLKEALTLLPERAMVKSRPSGHAVNAMLARVYLYMGDYENAKIHAGLSLSIDSSLLDYVNMNPNLSRPFQRLNSEVIFNTYLMTHSLLVNSPSSISAEALQLYREGDLRKKLFFTNPNAVGDVHFKGTYMGDLRLFSGLGNDEMILIMAECSARLGEIETALEAINRLRARRFSPDKLEPLATDNAIDLLRSVLEERRRQLMFRGNRWADIKRLSVDSVIGFTLEKEVRGEVLRMGSNDPRFAFLIPFDEIRISGIAQNPR